MSNVYIDNAIEMRAIRKSKPSATTEVCCDVYDQKHDLIPNQLDRAIYAQHLGDSLTVNQIKTLASAGKLL